MQANPRQLIVLLPGPDSTEEAHLEFLRTQAGYVEDSAEVEAIYPGAFQLPLDGE